jgi:uncharacterized repeat protein (TIGR01451 family)
MRALFRIRFAALALVALAAVVPVAAHPAAAQDAAGIALNLSTSATKAKLGDSVAFTVRVENVGTATYQQLSFGVGLPDALDAQTATCPAQSSADTVTDCRLAVAFGPGAVAEGVFVVRAGSRTRATNGPVSAFVRDADSGPLASATIPAIKIVGSPNG